MVRTLLSAVAFFATLSTTAILPVHAGQSAWEPLHPLLGAWKGESKGFGSTADVTHTWEMVLDGHFLRLQTKSVGRVRGPGSVHEDVGYASHDTDRGGLVFRQFLTEGFVNTFDVAPAEDDPSTIVFAHRESESSGGMRVQMRIRFLSNDEYEMELDLAESGKEFVMCQQMKMRRTDAGDGDAPAASKPSRTSNPGDH
jgi:hypothetical protein